MGWFKYLRKTIHSGETGKYEKNFMKIKFSSDDNWSLNKLLKLHNIKIVVTSAFQEDGKYILNFFRWIFVKIINVRTW